MTAKQKANRERFKKVVAEAKKLRKKNPKLTQAQAVKQAWAISYTKKRTKKAVGVAKKRKPTERDILNKIHKVKHDVERLDEAQHDHMSIGAIKSKGIKTLKHKYGALLSKKLTEKSKRAKKHIQKEASEIAKKIKKLASL